MVLSPVSMILEQSATNNVVPHLQLTAVLVPDSGVRRTELVDQRSAREASSDGLYLVSI